MAQAPVQRHVPLRTCIACGYKMPKRSMTRIVASPNGSVAADVGGKADGRGAYVCGREACVGDGLRRQRLSFALRVSVNDDDWAQIKRSISQSSRDEVDSE